jgi:hypothetical protein
MVQGRPTALAVSSGRAYIGVEKIGTPAQVSVMEAALSGTEMPRTLWSEPVTQVVEAVDYAGVERKLDSANAVFNNIEVGAGGDYVATSVAATYTGERISQANFPKMTIETDELRIVDSSSGGQVQRYRSWCDGLLYIVSIYEIDNWACATSPGQSEPAMLKYDHRIGSMTFLFGKK